MYTTVHIPTGITPLFNFTTLKNCIYENLKYKHFINASQQAITRKEISSATQDIHKIFRESGEVSAPNGQG